MALSLPCRFKVTKLEVKEGSISLGFVKEKAAIPGRRKNPLCYHHFLIIPDAERTLTLIPLLPSLFQMLEFILSCSPLALCWVMGPPAEASSISRGVLWDNTFVCGLEKGSRPWSPQHLTGTEELRDLSLMSSQPSQFRLVPVRVGGNARKCL